MRKGKEREMKKVSNKIIQLLLGMSFILVAMIIAYGLGAIGLKLAGIEPPADTLLVHFERVIVGFTSLVMCCVFYGTIYFVGYLTTERVRCIANPLIGLGIITVGTVFGYCFLPSGIPIWQTVFVGTIALLALSVILGSCIEIGQFITKKVVKK